ncbi:MAG: SDR family oxidoreductase [Methanophagales archaeon]|nr:SDR family oxidoreductase [Methanophagales archaeon]
MKAVVTGGAGFIGSNLAEELAKAKEKEQEQEQENEVVVVDNLSTGRRENLQNLKNLKKCLFVEGSVTDLDLLRGVFKGCDFVFHQAAIPSVPRSVKDPLATNNVNTNGTLNVLVAARDCGVKKVVFASSSSVYGDTPELPKREEMTPNPLSPYAVTKLVGEYYCKVFEEVYGLKTVSLRYFNVYGPRQDPHSDYAAVVPKFVKSVSENKPPVIFGDGEQTRDFTFVKDVVRANLLAAKSGATGVFNIASGRRVSINELAEKIIKIQGKELEPVHSEPREGDVKHSLGDISRAQRGFGFEPRYSLEEGLGLLAV